MNFEDLHEGRRAGARCFVVTGNLWDLFLASGLPPARLPVVLAASLQREGFTTVVVSRSMGWLVLAPGQDEATRKRRSDRIQTLAGFRSPEGSPIGADSGASGMEPQELLSAVDRLLLQQEQPVAVLVDFPQHIVPATPGGMASVATPEQQIALERFHRWGQDDAVRTGGNLLILLAADGAVHPLLLNASGYRMLRAGLPNDEQRRRFLDLFSRLRERGRTEFAGLAPELSPSRAAALTAGLRLADIEAIARARAAVGMSLDSETIRREKARSIAQRCDDLLEVIEPSCNLSKFREFLMWSIF